jgi:hypothetical protein
MSAEEALSPVPVPLAHVSPGPIPAAAADGLPLPIVLRNRYRLEAAQGTGVMGTVYRAVDLVRGRTVAVRVFPSALARDAAFRARVLAHARKTALLVHPYLATVVEAGVSAGYLYLVEEFVEGPSLRALLQLRGRQPVHTTVTLAAQLAEALAYVHAQGMVHGDLRPETVLLDREGRPKIVALGLRQLVNPLHLPGGEAVAHTAYVAPELRRGAAPSPQSDLYALGAILYELLVGTPPAGPWNGREAAPAPSLLGPPLLRTERPDVTPGLEQAIRQALAPEPSERPATAHAFRTALFAPPPPLPSFPGARGRARRSPLDQLTWAGQPLAIGLPLAATLVVLLLLARLLDVLPPVVVPFQAVRVPELRNRSFAEAELTAKGAGLEVAKTRPEPCDQYGRDFVIRQEPDPGTLVHRGTRIRLTTCSGIRVPNLVGLREEQARIQVVHRGWTVSGVRFVPTTEAPPGTVLAQEPAPDLIVPEKQPLVLTVAQAPR